MDRSLWYEARTANNFYPTPALLVERMLTGLVVRQGDVILEPSAGTGHMAEVIRRRYPNNELRCVEISTMFQHVLRDKQFRVVGGDVFDYREVADVIIANPPFCNNFQDIDHFLWYWHLLAPGGRMACIMHEYSVFPRLNLGKPALFARFLRAVNAQRQLNPAGSFLSGDRPTATGTAIVWVTKGL